MDSEDPTRLYYNSKEHLVSTIIRELQKLRCPEAHHAGQGSCPCNTNDTLDDVEELVIRLEEESYGL